MNPIQFWVAGLPAPGGSKRGFVTKAGRVAIVDACDRSKGWKSLVADAARDLVPDLLRGPLMVRMTFVMPRPAGHFGTGRNAAIVKKSAPIAPIGKPDVLKLARSTEDALSGVIWHDDAATVCLVLVKQYGPKAGAFIEIQPLATAPQGFADLPFAKGA